MRALRLVFITLQHLLVRTWSEHHARTVVSTLSEDNTCTEDVEPPQALLQYDRMISQSLIVPSLQDSADYTTDDRHGLDDDNLYGPIASDHTSKSESEHGAGPVPPQHGNQHAEQHTEQHGEHHDGQHHHAESEEGGEEDVDQLEEVATAGQDHVHKPFVHGGHRSHHHPLLSGHNHHTDPPSATSTVIALMLVGMMAMGMSLFYLVNYPDEDIQQVTWTILSSTISLFCAVLIFSALKAVLGICLGERVGPHSHHLEPDWTTVIFSFLHFFFIFAINQLMLALHKNKNFPLKAWATIGGHMNAFAAIEAFGNLYHYYFSSSWQKGCILLVMASVTVTAVWLFAGSMRSRLQTHSKEQHLLFTEVCDEAGREYVSLTIGFLVSLLIRHMITAHLPPVHGSPRNKTQTEIWLLFIWSITFIILLMVFAYMAREVMKQTHGMASAVAHMAQNVLSMSGGWCLLSWGQWLFWSSVGESMGEADKMQARMIMAIAFSAVVLSSIFIFDFIADHLATQSGLRALISTMALLLGLAWEAVFTLSIESISGHYIEHPSQYIYCELGLTFILCGIVLPAWVMYFLPKAEEGQFLAEEQ